MGVLDVDVDVDCWCDGICVDVDVVCVSNCVEGHHKWDSSRDCDCASDSDFDCGCLDVRDVVVVT